MRFFVKFYLMPIFLAIHLFLGVLVIPIIADTFGLTIMLLWFFIIVPAGCAALYKIADKIKM